MCTNQRVCIWCSSDKQMSSYSFVVTTLSWFLSFLCALFTFGGVSFVCDSSPFGQNRKYFFRSLLAVLIGFLLIAVGKFNSLSIGSFDLPLFYFAGIMGLLNTHINNL